MSAAESLAVYETSLSSLSEHDWRVLSSRWARGIDWCVRKVGRHWTVGESFGTSWPLYKTKHAAWEAVDNLMVITARYRAAQRQP